MPRRVPAPVVFEKLSTEAAMRRFAAAVFGLGLMVAPAFGDEAADADGIRRTIDAQMQAFQADDGAAAYGFASPRLQQIFPNADVFMSMVKNGYQPVYRPRSVTWGRLKEIPGGYAQEVFVVGPDGEPYTALYALERQPDGSWRISGCKIVRSDAESA
jgi:hypothetical protein